MLAEGGYVPTLTSVYCSECDTYVFDSGNPFSPDDWTFDGAAAVGGIITAEYSITGIEVCDGVFFDATLVLTADTNTPTSCGDAVSWPATATYEDSCGNTLEFEFEAFNINC
jgi:hypothetical protein